MTKAEIDAVLPPLTLTFGSDPAISIQALASESYIKRADGKWCPGIFSTGFLGTSWIGRSAVAGALDDGAEVEQEVMKFDVT